MNDSICILGRGPACEPDKLIVQIIGKHHPDTQKLLLCNAQGQPLEADTAAAVTERLTYDDVSSVLKLWDWQALSAKALYLEVASESGPPLRLPLLRDLRVTPRQFDAQLNQIVPIVPCTALPGIRSAQDMGTPVLVRSGYIYVFYHGKLWRELEVRFSDAGTFFHDIDVASYRQAQGFAVGKRLASGVALEDIWLPAQGNGQRAGAAQLMFSEVQLSAPRLDHLESHELRLAPRTRSPNLLVTEAGWEKHWANCPDGQAMLEAFSSGATSPTADRFRMELLTFPVNLCAPQRQRQPGHEWLLDQPAHLLCDLTGGYPEKAGNTTRQLVETWRTGVAAAPPAEFESEAWRSCYAGCDPDAAAVWQALPAQTDALQSARDRQLYAVLLPDPMYRLRHLHARIDSLQELLSYCTQLAVEHPHHASALLLHNLAVPPRIGGGRNPLYHSLQGKLNDNGKQQINIATAAVERAQVWRLLESAQQALAEGLKLEEYQQCLADHLSLDDFDYAASMFFAARLLACLATTPAQLDPLAIRGDIHDAVTGARLHFPGRNPGQLLLSEIANRANHPLHVMLWPQVSEDQLFAAYQRPAEDEPNQGDGRFRATALARLEDQDAPDDDSDTLDGMTLAALMNSGSLQDSFSAHPSFRAGMAVLGKINDILNSAVLAAQSRLTGLANDTIANNQATARHQADLQRVGRDQSRHRGELGEHARTADIRLHGMSTEQLRQMLPSAFEGARFVRIGNVTLSDYYLFGLEDLPEVDPNAAATRMYGQYLDVNGRELGMTNARSARRAGMPVVPESGVYFAIPRNSATAGILSQLNHALHEQALAGSALVASQANARQLGAALQEATDRLRRARDGALHRTLNSKPFSAAVLMLEMWNVRVAMQESERIELERGWTRSVAGNIGAWGELVLAFEILVAKFSASQPLTVFAERTVFRMSQQRLEGIFGVRLAAYVIKEVTVRLLGQITAGLLLTGLNLSDALHASRWADNAIWGHYMMAAGGLLAAGGALVVGSALFGPVGLAALVLIIGGAAVVALLSNTPFEDWLAGSVFGEEGALSSAIRSGVDLMPGITSRSRHLEDPDEGFYRLVGLFSGIQISIEPNPDYDPQSLGYVQGSPQQIKTRASTRITVRSNIRGMAAQLGSPNLIVQCQLFHNEISYGHGRDGLGRRAVLRPLGMSNPLLQHVTPDALVLYFNTPANTRQSHPFQNMDEYHWEVRAQFRLHDTRQSRIWAFPAPGPRAAPVNPADHTEPSFRKKDQLLWADQDTHTATGATG